MEALHLAGPGKAQQEQHQLAASLEEGWWQCITAIKPHAVTINNGDQDSAQAHRQALYGFKKKTAENSESLLHGQKKGEFSRKQFYSSEAKFTLKPWDFGSEFILPSCKIIPSQECPTFLHCYMIHWAEFFLFVHDAPNHRQRIRKAISLQDDHHTEICFRS